MILQKKQVLSSIIEFRVSDTVQEFKKFNKSLLLHLPCVINHMAALWEFISVSITNTHPKSLINDCCLLNLTVNQLQQAAQEWATYRPLCGLVFHSEEIVLQNVMYLRFMWLDMLHIPLSEKGSALRTGLSFFALNIMRITGWCTLISLSAIVSQSRLNPIMHHVRRALPVYDNASYSNIKSNLSSKI